MAITDMSCPGIPCGIPRVRLVSKSTDSIQFYSVHVCSENAVLLLSAVAVVVTVGVVVVVAVAVAAYVVAIAIAVVGGVGVCCCCYCCCCCCCVVVAVAAVAVVAAVVVVVAVAVAAYVVAIAIAVVGGVVVFVAVFLLLLLLLLPLLVLVLWCCCCCLLLFQSQFCSFEPPCRWIKKANELNCWLNIPTWFATQNIGGWWFWQVIFKHCRKMMMPLYQKPWWFGCRDSYVLYNVLVVVL